MRENPFDLDEPIAADFKAIFYLFLADRKFRRVDHVVSRVSAGGVSDLKRVSALMRRLKIVWRKDSRIRVVSFYFRMMARELLVGVFKSILPVAIKDRMLVLKYKIRGEKFHEN
jgi:hypothetical protein